MMSKNVEILLEFVEKINNSDSDGLFEMMTDNHVFIDLAGDRVVGRDRMLNAWEGYMKAFPDYRIYISDIFADEDKVILYGSTTGSHLDLADDEEFVNEKFVWLSEIYKDKVALWQTFKNSPQIQNELEISTKERVENATVYEIYRKKLQEIKQSR